MKDNGISVVIPIHNEAAHLAAFVEKFLDDLGQTREELREILLMENGSSDNTWAVCRELQERFPRLVKARTLENPSYGEAIKQGMLAAEGSLTAILECDFLDADFLRAAYREVEQEGADFVVASKRHPQSRDHRPFIRRFITWGYNTFLSLLFGFDGTDTHGLKLIRAEQAKKLCRDAITGGEIFQTELVLLAARQGYNIREVPIRIEEHRAPQIGILKRIPKVMNIIWELRRSLKRFPRRKKSRS